MKKPNYGSSMQDAMNKSINEGGIKVRTQAKPFYEAPKPPSFYDQFIAGLKRQAEHEDRMRILGTTYDDPTSPYPEPPLERATWRRPGTKGDDLDRLVTRQYMRLVMTREPYLEAYDPEENERHRKKFEEQQAKTSKNIAESQFFKHTTPSKTVVIDLTKGEVVKVMVKTPEGKEVMQDYFYPSMIRSENEHKAAVALTKRGALKEMTNGVTVRQRTLKAIQGEKAHIEKQVRQMRFLERFLSGETRQEISKTEKITSQRIMDVMLEGVRRLGRVYTHEIMFVESYGEQHSDLAEYPDYVAFHSPRTGKEIMDNKDVLLVFVRRYYDEYLRPAQHNLMKEEGEYHV